ncbi:inositol monophosphatase [Synechococcus sp. Nb3U1]|uniref:inositol monophosphatase family protein n=1 Tax=Synechococcus sp. Nb3U1 TaxID=1914529 RepID=UPI001F15C197|nr:inositol monophosphatase family protein [Synechococcus sp. Nb3U1]MCF2970557.1 inositol monophosphatase [Synechococcus sp. Nb3U1]
MTDALLCRLDVASEAALEAAALLRSYAGGTLAIEEKRPGDLVTAADRASEDLILNILKRHFPEDVILTEESGQQGSAQGLYAWMIDPLDGTTNFAHGYPFAAVSMGLLQGREPVLGVICDVFQGDLFRAGQGMGATRNHKPIQVSTTTELSRSLLVTGFAYDRRETSDNNYAEFCHFTHLTQGVRRGGSAALDLAYVATGQLDGYWERGLSPWDIAAGIVLVREAGGKVTAYDGSPVDVYSGRLLASNGELHSAMQQELAQVRPLPVSFPMRAEA